ncbi:MAG TPA: hypothetical protein VIC85_05550 [Ktedonobacterales bacterium]|jgi:hypothetical protein
MIQTTVRLERPEGTVLLRGIPVQIELGADMERHDLEGARPYDLCAIYTTRGVPSVPIQRRDVLFDELNADPETGQLAKYRVVGPVETFENDHQEMIAERVVGG